ncbi:hypothetical protein K652_20092 [Pseudomonas aeruginosa VRFPA02]|nr:hypothetical protein K652_20092 [Pseudomonas aeruginosa VRFPA02]
MLGGCAQPPRLPPESAALPARVELREVPFFPQEAYQCGPAALATMLGQRGLALTPGQLKDEVFIPGREGSLQLEMVAAARRHGMLVYPLQGGLESVLEEVAAGNPVLVLQNQAFSWWPRWHFAVVVGFDRERRELVLRSGITRRWVTDFTSFESTWKRSGRWAVLTLPGDRLPATAAAVPWLKAASDSEETGHPKVARRAYEEAVRRWPEDAFAWFALGNSRYAAGDSAAAEQAMLTSVERRVDFAAGWFNLSQLLAERGCAAPARQAQACARALQPGEARFAAALPQLAAGRRTRGSVRRAAGLSRWRPAPLRRPSRRLSEPRSSETALYLGGPHSGAEHGQRQADFAPHPPATGQGRCGGQAPGACGGGHAQAACARRGAERETGRRTFGHGADRQRAAGD